MPDRMIEEYMTSPRFYGPERIYQCDGYFKLKRDRITLDDSVSLNVVCRVPETMIVETDDLEDAKALFRRMGAL